MNNYLITSVIFAKKQRSVLMFTMFSSVFLISLTSFTTAFAYPIINVNSPSSGKSTINLSSSGAFGTTGSQAFNLDFAGDFSNLTDINNAYYSLDGVVLSGAVNQNGAVLSQNTLGGSIKIYQNSFLTDLIFSANLSSGTLSGSGDRVTFTSWTTNLNGGSALAQTSAQMFDIALTYNLDNCPVFSKRCFLASTPPNNISIGSNGSFVAFDGILKSGIIDGKLPSPPVQPIPEPATGLLLGSGLYGLLKRSRKRST